MTASEVRCCICGSTYLVPRSFSAQFEQDRLIHWAAEHDCVPALEMFR